jgi:hypothetical protein
MLSPLRIHRLLKRLKIVCSRGTLCRVGGSDSRHRVPRLQANSHDLAKTALTHTLTFCRITIIANLLDTRLLQKHPQLCS